jgi:hypothetical protein
MSTKKERSLVTESIINKESDIKKEQTVGLLESIENYNTLTVALESIILELQTKLLPVLKTTPLNINDMELREVDAAQSTISILKLNLKLEKLINVLYNLENNVGI